MPNKTIRLIAILLIVVNSTVWSQASWKMGYHAFPGLNLYQSQSPSKTSQNNSVGQVLNLVPDIQLGIWTGKPKKICLGVDAGVSYAPFALNLQNYNGMGAISFPVLIRGQFRIKDPLVSHAIILGLASGVQWQRQELYLRSDQLKSSFAPAFCVEVSGGIGAVGIKGQKTRAVDSFIRCGFGNSKSFSINWGLRLQLWNTII